MRLLLIAFLTVFSFCWGLALARREDGIIFKSFEISASTKLILFPLQFLNIPRYNILGILYLAITVIPSYVIIPGLIVINIKDNIRLLLWVDLWGGILGVLLTSFVAVSFLESIISDFVIKRR